VKRTIPSLYKYIFKGDNPVGLIDADYDNEEFMTDLHPLKDEKEGGARCAVCIKKRMEYTAVKAKELGYDFFTTTLTVSPHKNSEMINKIGASLEEKYGIRFLYSDFKKEDGYLKSIKYSKEYNLYRQNYCGCRYSIYDDIDGD
jgi:predicted adenine nucleotide alpha hydrolase (AANH) superfamily ATPase